MKSSPPRNPFYKKKFYLDLVGCPPDVEKQLSKDLKLFGGRETFFSKDVRFVVSARAPLPSKPWTPATPKTGNSPTLSPQFYSENSMGSPEYNNTQTTEKRSFAPSQSRGLVLLQKAQLQKQGGRTDILELCKRYKIEVYPLKTVQSCINKLKNYHYGKEEKTEMAKKKDKSFNGSSNEVKKIRSPFVKIEDVNRRYRTRHRVFNSWADIIDPALSQSVKELHNNFMKCGTIQLETLFRPILKEITANKRPTDNGGFLVPITPSHTKSFTKASVTPQASPSVSAMSTDIRKKKEPAPCADKKKKRKKKQQYCEICCAYYASLKEHVEEKYHTKFMNDSTHFSKIENIIASIPKLKDSMKLLKVDTEKDNFKSGFSQYSWCKKNSGFTSYGTLGVSPTINEACNLFSSDSSEASTQLYSFDDTIISATCSTASVGLSFLEDKLDQTTSANNSICDLSCNSVSNNPGNLEGDLSNVENITPIQNADDMFQYEAFLDGDLTTKEDSDLVPDLDSKRNSFSNWLENRYTFASHHRLAFKKNDKNNQLMEQSPSTEMPVSSSMSFPNFTFSSDNAKKGNLRSKKRKRKDNSESFLLKKFLKEELPSCIHDIPLNVSKEASCDSGVCSLPFSPLYCEESICHGIEESDLRLSGNDSSLTHFQPIDMSHRIEESDLRLSGNDSCLPHFQSMDTSEVNSLLITNLTSDLSVTLTDINESRTNLSPPVLDVYNLLLPPSENRDSYDWMPVLSIAPTVKSDINNLIDPSLSESYSSEVSLLNSTSKNNLGPEQVLSEEMTNINHEVVSAINDSDSRSQLCGLEYQFIVANDGSDGENISPANPAQSVCVYHPNSPFIQLLTVASNKISLTFVSEQEEENSKNEGLSPCKGKQKLFKSDQLLNCFKEFFLCREEFIFFTKKNCSTMFLTSKSLLENLLSVSSQTYSHYLIKNLGEIFIAKNGEQFSRKIVLSFCLAKEDQKTKNDFSLTAGGKEISNVFIVLNSFKKIIRPEFIVYKLGEILNYYPQNFSSQLKKFLKVIKKSMCLQNKNCKTYAVSFCDCTGGGCFETCVCDSYLSCEICLYNINAMIECDICHQVEFCNDSSCLRNQGSSVETAEPMDLSPLRNPYNNTVSRLDIPIDEVPNVQNKDLISVVFSAKDVAADQMTSAINNMIVTVPEKNNQLTCVQTYISSVESDADGFENSDLQAIPRDESAENVNYSSVSMKMDAENQETSCIDSQNQEKEAELSFFEDFYSDEEYIIVEEDSSEEQDWTEIQHEVQKKCKALYSEEF